MNICASVKHDSLMSISFLDWVIKQSTVWCQPVKPVKPITTSRECKLVGASFLEGHAAAHSVPEISTCVSKNVLNVPSLCSIPRPHAIKAHANKWPNDVVADSRPRKRNEGRNKTGGLKLSSTWCLQSDAIMNKYKYQIRNKENMLSHFKNVSLDRLTYDDDY